MPMRGRDETHDELTAHRIVHEYNERSRERSFSTYPQTESNRHLPLRTGTFYPLNYGGTTKAYHAAA